MRSTVDIISVRGDIAARAADLAIAVLGAPNRAMSSKRELRFGRYGSLSVVIAGPKAGMWHDHQIGSGGDMISLIMRERGGAFRDAVEYAQQFIGGARRDEPPPKSIHADDDGERNRQNALDIWSRASPIAGTPAHGYLTARGLRSLPAGADGEVLRFHPSCPYQGGRRPCMLSLLRDIKTNAPRAIQRTALSEDGTKLGRMTLGPKAGAAIKLTGEADVATALTIGEGLETTLAGMILGYAPAWALGDAGELAAFPVLPGIESITILVDHDRSGTGQRAALRCSERWTSAGREVFRLVPRQPGADVNDLLKCKGAVS